MKEVDAMREMMGKRGEGGREDGRCRMGGVGWGV